MTEQTQQIAKKSPMDAFKTMLKAESIQEQIRNAMGENSSLFTASLIDTFGSNPSLQKCKPADVIKQALKAAVLKLPLTTSLGLAYLVVYNNKQKKLDANGFPVIDENTHKEVWETVPTPTFIPGYKGLNQLALRSGLYKRIHADVVYEGEFVSRDKLTGDIDLSGRKISDKIVGFFGYLELTTGYTANVWWPIERMAKHAKRTSKGIPKDVTVESLIATMQSGESNGKVGWLGDPIPMALKTCIRDLITKHGIISIEMQTLIANEVQFEQSEEEPTQSAKQAVTFEDTTYEEVVEPEKKADATEELPSFAK